MEEKTKKFIENLMGDINLVESENNRPLGLEVSAGLLSYIISKKHGRKSSKRPVLDHVVDDLISGFIIKIEAFAKNVGMDSWAVADLLMQKTLRLGRLQIQNPRKFDPSAKMTGQ